LAAFRYPTYPRLSPPALEPQDSDEVVEFHFLDVGQGDCTLVEFPTGYSILVDCGSNDGGDAQYVNEYLKNELEDDQIDALVITHPDGDHYNLLRQGLSGIQVDHIYMSGEPSEHGNADVDSWISAFDVSQRTVLAAEDFDDVDEPNDTIPSDSGEVRVVAANVPAVNTGSNFAVNARSIVLLVSYGGFDVMLTGDATFGTEEKIRERFGDSWLDCEVLKVGHHGSSTTSTHDDWLAAVRPETAVVSASSTNTYGHPRKSVLERVADYTVSDVPHTVIWGWWANNRGQIGSRHGYRESIYNTASSGTVVISSNGDWYEVRTDQ